MLRSLFYENNTKRDRFFGRFKLANPRTMFELKYSCRTEEPIIMDNYGLSRNA